MVVIEGPQSSTSTRDETRVLTWSRTVSSPTRTGAAVGRGDSKTEARPEVEQVALFTNPQGVYNAYSGTWDPPPGHVLNGKYWYEPCKVARRNPIPKEEIRKTATKAKQRAVRAYSSSDGSDARPRRKRVKAAVKQVTPAVKTVTKLLLVGSLEAVEVKPEN
ncbi:unnamed protein product [Phytophthora fragariaefolia]|uniref:Unnamed protein product n=1 Tax=Phytophthora fragariaefolia TaxID=1490495 RepID=A0A9W7CP73_9STRA|nr:unnamed protein product [Phytophthora fragariaefolia]